jgi:hypothetical protein
MNRILAALLLLALSLPASAEVWQARYGVSTKFDFKLYNADGTLDVDEADGGTEVSLACDEGAETTATNDFVDEGTFYSITLTAAEMKCERIAVVVAATTTEVFFVQTSALDAGVVTYGTAQSATGTTIVLASATSFADDFLNCRTILITGGTGAGQAKPIDDWTSSSDTATVSTWTTNPDSTSVYEVYGTACGSLGADAITDSVLAASAGTELGTAAWATTTRSLTVLDEDSTTLDLNATAVGSVAGAVGSVTGNVGGNVTGSVGSVAANGVSASSLAVDAGTELAAAVTATQGIITGTCDSGSTTTCVDNALTQADATQLEDRLICFDDSWCALITTFTPGSDTATTTKTAPSTRASKAYTIFPSTLE